MCIVLNMYIVLARMHKRVTEHQNISNLRAVINEHKSHSKHDFEWKDVNILEYESNWFKRTISEMLHMQQICYKQKD